jgi:putative ABC transport system substrate-binding protein
MRRIGLAVVLAASLVLAAATAESQQTGTVHRIGILASGSALNIMVPFRQALSDGLAAELVRLKVDVLVATSNVAVAAAQKATTSIPIVMTNTSDPVALGFVASLARPGGNITGLTIQAPDVAGKALQLLREAVPGLSRLAVLWDTGFLGRQTLSELQAAARVVKMPLQLVEVRSPSELEGAFDAIARDRTRAVFIAGSPLQFGERARIAELAVTRRFATMCVLREYVEAGCLIGYGASLVDGFRRAAYFVDRILKGAKPADLPVEQPTRLYFVINLKTAKALGLTIPQTLLMRIR